MNNELKELLSKEKDNVLAAQQERALPEEVVKKIKEARVIENELKKAEKKGMRLNNLIAKKLIEIYLKEKEKHLYLEEPAIKHSFDLIDITDEPRLYKNFYYEKIYFQRDGVGIARPAYDIWLNYNGKKNELSSFKIKKMLKEKNRVLAIWALDDDRNDYSNTSYDLVCVNVDFFKKQGISINTKDASNIPHVEFDMEALEEFVKNVLKKQYSEITLDREYITNTKNRLKEIEEEKISLKALKEKLNLNVKIVALDLCKLAIMEYNNVQNYDLKLDKTTFAFDVEVMKKDKSIKLLSDAEQDLLLKYKYYGSIYAFPHNVDEKVEYIPIIIDDLKPLINEIGIYGHLDRDINTYLCTTYISELENAVLKSSEEETKTK